jgi:hypothetical protein
MNVIADGIIEAARAAVIGGLIILVGFLGSLIVGTVLYYLWHWAAPLYFDFLPVKYVAIPWFDTVLLTWLFSIVGDILFKSTDSSKED